MAAQNDLPPIRACLFDMDGLLIDSEDLYTICTNEILHEYGKPSLPWNIKAQLQGRPRPEANRIFNAWAQLPISTEEFYAKSSALQRKYFPRTQPLPGVPELLKTLDAKTSPKVHIALATSTHSDNFALKSGHLGELFSVFKQENRVLGDDPRIPAGRGKPAPDIYLVALETINARLRKEGKEPEVKPEECLVFEDSVPGVESGRRAGMQVVWCPHPGLLEEYKGREAQVLAGLTGEHKDDTEGENIAGEAEMEGEKATGKTRREGAPGEVGDGRGRLLKSLEGFPYQDFGIKVTEGAEL
ncbi:HAD-like protein [Saccharata proteae CBS 121410]|uniref:HAD-like protein n=1 Tax=Saccharata proteae CBS 121410 TaxID=1314787 RepID=A0A9P4LXM0_9PEZI|nr:HAD-like protein [Saccharata proteae CBS 121410]